MTKNHPKEIFSSVTSRGAALWRSFSSSKMKQVQYETSMKNIPLGGNKEYVMQLTKSVRKVVYAMSWVAFIFLNTTQWNKQPELVILLVFDKMNRSVVNKKV